MTARESLKQRKKRRLRRPPLRLQLAALYAGLIMALVAVALTAGISSGFFSIMRGGSIPFPGGGPDSGRTFDLGPAIVFLIAAVVAFWLAWWLAGRSLRPLRAMNATAREISATNLNRRLGLDGPHDELTELGQTLDDLFARLEAAFDSQRRFIANAAHELRTPLTAERTLLQVALADPAASTETLRSTCEEVLALGEQQARLIEALLTLASSERGIERWEPFDLAVIAGEVALLRRQEAVQRGVQVDLTLEAGPAVGDRQLVESLVANLVDNALRYNREGGRVEIVTTARASQATLQVGNTGPAIPEEEIDRLFQPFQRLGNARVRREEGLGLGLAIVQAIVKAHGAALSTRARPEGGLDIAVTFSAPQSQCSGPGCADARPSVSRA